MRKLDLKKSIKKFAEDTKQKIKDEIVRTDTIDTGDLLRSIDYYQAGNFVQFSMLDYGKYTDQGTRYIQPPREFFNKVIEDNSNDFESYIEDELLLEIEKMLIKR